MEAQQSLVLALTAIFFNFFQPTWGCVLNTDPTYVRWKQFGTNVIPFVFYSGDYTAAEQSLILQAMAQIKSDMGGCITWTQYTSPPTGGVNYVMISKAGGVGSQSCFTFPGMINLQQGKGQYMAIQGGVNGCLSNVRQVMRLLMSLLGQRFEHNKPNRDAYVNVNTGIATSVSTNYGVYNIYNPTLVLSNPADFDYNSVTLMDQVTFSNTGTPVVTGKTKAINNVGRLSLKDCQCLSFLYSCSVACQDVYSGGPLPTQFTRLSSTSTGTSTSASTTTTPFKFPFDLGRR
ncbi:hypothetical protein BV898_01201 [Hypsibius exemplaris]|uniref:Peptidase M12A domain-containing protein n=1 Tax=Hypsibius exemplaris TaxID=2072580 RepID=A0A1W0XBV7_HYPEX|nr:hypothetical protein BV898_01201 [Hypsibius exemplaris]